jgi:outer membrane protein OmpA-like peptidoglycan-associated protein
MAMLLFAGAGARAQVTFGGSASGSAQTGPTRPAPAPTPAPAAPAAASAAAAPAGEAAVAETMPIEDDEWADRDRKLNEGAAYTGGVGLFRMLYAQGGAPGQFRLGFNTEYFSAGFLCTTTFPCRDPRTGQAVTSDSLDHIGATINVTVGILKWLEFYAATGAYASSDDKNRPSLIQVLGDTTFGFKAYGAVSKVFHVGGGFNLLLVNGTGAVGLAGGGTGAKFFAMPTIDLRGMDKPVPLRFGLQLAYSLDNSGTVVEQTEKDRGAARGAAIPEPVTRIERFGLRINRVDHFDIGLGAELFAASERVRPFLEYTLEAPINRQNYLCKPNNPSQDKCLANEQIAPSRLTLGGRFYPWKQGFGLLAALDIGVTGVGTFIEEVAPTPPWTLYLGAQWAIDTKDRPPVEKIKTVEKVVQTKKPGAVIKGLVYEGAPPAAPPDPTKPPPETPKGPPVAGAIVSYQNHPEWNAIVTNPDGRFTTMELPEGPYVFEIKADGYKPGTCQTQIAKDQKEAQVECPIEALPKMGTVTGHIKDADTGAPIAGASVKLVDVQGKENAAGTDGTGGYKLDQIPPGTATITVDAADYLATSQQLDVKPRSDNPTEITLKKRPKNPLVTVGRTEINIKEQIQFAVDSAQIKPESTALLTQIADALIKNPGIKKVEIQGHTDNSGTSQHNKVLSEDRAAAVKNWLTSHGVSEGRLTSKGYGESRPLVPNVTAGNRERNRRVQFIIVEREGGEAPKEAPKKPAAPEKQNPFNLPPP